MGVENFGKKKSPMESRSNIPTTTAAIFLIMLVVSSCVANAISARTDDATDNPYGTSTTGMLHVKSNPMIKKKLCDFSNEEIRKMTPEILASFEIGDFYLLDADQVLIILKDPLKFDALDANKKMAVLRGRRNVPE